MFSAQNEKAEEVETKEPFVQKFHPGWKDLPGLKRFVVLADGMHFAAFFEKEVQICNLQTQQCVLTHPDSYNINAVTLLSTGEIVVAEHSDFVHIIKYDAETNALDVLFSFQTYKSSFIAAMTGLEDGSLAFGDSDGFIRIWKLVDNKYKEIKNFRAAFESIHAMDTRQDGNFVVSDGRNIQVYNSQYTLTFRFIETAAEKLIILPDDTLVYYAKEMLYHTDIKEAKCLGFQKVPPLIQLNQMPDGRISCLAENSLQFFEPSWVRNYVAADTTTKAAVRAHLPADVTEIVACYAGIALFNAPKMPQKRKCVLAEDAAPALKR